MYSDDNDYTLTVEVAAVGSSWRPSWSTLLANNGYSEFREMQCPSFAPYGRIYGDNADNIYCYAMPGEYTANVTFDDKYGYQSDPSQWVWLIDSYIKSHVSHGDRGDIPLQFYSIQKGRTGDDYAYVHMRHAKMTNAGFADGHAATIGKDERVSNNWNDDFSYYTLAQALQCKDLWFDSALKKEGLTLYNSSSILCRWVLFFVSGICVSLMAQYSAQKTVFYA